MMRPALLLLSGDACGEVTQDHVVLAAVVEIRLKRRARPGRKGSEPGEIAIRFESLDELNGLLDKLGVTAASTLREVAHCLKDAPERKEATG
jgi:hypothetical protein